MTQGIDLSKLCGMDANQIIEIMGGRAKVMKLTGLTKGRISQWAKEDHIPRAWLMAFHRMKPRQIPRPVEKGSKASSESLEANHA
ncbi:Cro/Cl family transcriptional regulator [Bordetella hinzii]|uniref:Cro/Cl family transcriptional regulator n=1 Tax=Bordetella hinzii TaxID=103855 RepID=UPI001C029D36|nr:Cro/Cl family transcriptional regulator [Bordetella hinzii]QWF40069.1 hypothetical protein HHA25_18225 [Bordetella hinzii]QWF44615.1 hypothetical protein HHA24_18215 [Bordetella hinzii]QWF49151.1 hypothetical protein HHA23_18215 [Bordetella hinzii]QWF53687.1 hypothetical protein HHA22_18220 [Bordetella hinzii]QWF58177.1 hypothetical protein HHA21_17975 [Bordetella hinzii]